MERKQLTPENKEKKRQMRNLVHVAAPALFPGGGGEDLPVIGHVT